MEARGAAAPRGLPVGPGPANDPPMLSIPTPVIDFLCLLSSKGFHDPSQINLSKYKVSNKAMAQAPWLGHGDRLETN